MQIESFGLSDIGLSRHNNEDVWAEIPSLHFYVLADGMGGHLAGEIASTEAVESLIKTIRHILTTKSPLSNNDLSLELKEAILEANSWVYHLSRENREMQGMGTTLCCCLLNQNTLIYAHIGDSRIYRFREQLECLTKDHSLKKQIEEDYHLYEHRLIEPTFKNVITKAIGTSSHVEPDIDFTEVKTGDIYFLCSDGLTDAVEEEEIAAILRQSPTIQIACDRLVKSALAHGGHDNITLLMIKMI